uniref:Uncharacterized protein n=1 Tax=Anguilla anguilla TaxID=7936 RepID=A0A0E9V2H4_ANGAN
MPRLMDISEEMRKKFVKYISLEMVTKSFISK